MIKFKGSITFKEAIKKFKGMIKMKEEGSKFRDSTFFVKILEVQAKASNKLT